MPGLMIWLIMNALKKSKPNNIHYVPRDYEAVRNQGRENSTKLPLPKNTVKEKTPYGYWYCKPGANRKKVLFYIHGGGFNSGGAEYSINMTRNFCKSADNTGCCKGERRQWRKQRTEAGAAVAECEGLLLPMHDAGTATRHY